MKLPTEILLSELLNYSVKGNKALNYGNGENVWMHPPVHRILGWYSRPSNFDLKRNVWRLNQITQIIDNEIYVKGDPACLLYTSPSPRDVEESRMPSSA